MADKFLSPFTSLAISRQAVPGDWEFDCLPVYSIAFMNFTLPELGEDVKVEAMWWNMNASKPLNRKFRLFFIQLPLFKLEREEDCKTQLDRWLFTLVNMNKMESMPFADSAQVFEDLQRKLSRAALNSAESLHYERELKAYRDAVNQYRYAQREGLAKGRQEGLERGRKEGMEQGLREGIETGRRETLAANIFNMTREGLTDDLISRCLGISPAEVLELKQAFGDATGSN